MRQRLYALCGALLLAGSAHAAYEERYSPCLNYWVVGDSNCAPEQVSKTVVQKPPSPTVAVAPAPAVTQTAQISPTEPTLDEKIDDFIENHGKPPREFVAFHLEPTLENALKWVYKYNEMLKRNLELTRAWMQAEAIYDQSVSKGEDVSSLATEMKMPVPDYGVNVPNMPRTFMFDPKPLAALPTTATAAMTAAGQTPPTATANPFGSTQPLEEGRIGGESSIMQIDYYFSAECPYCKKFEPEFKQVLASLAFPVQVTCVDITPSGRDINNILGKLNCDWRPGGPTEMQRMGIRTTPSLIINRGNGQPLERISGYVEGKKLKEHLLKGSANIGGK